MYLKLGILETFAQVVPSADRRSSDPFTKMSILPRLVSSKRAQSGPVELVKLPSTDVPARSLIDVDVVK